MKTAISFLVLFVAIFNPFRSDAAWEKVQNLPTQVKNTYLLDVYFLRAKPQYGWACGYNGHILRTTDGGKTWLFSQAPASFQAESIVFLDENTGYLSGDDMIFKSTDGGASWKKLNIGTDPRVWGCAFYDTQNGVAVGGGCDGSMHFYRTTNGGSNWTLTSQPGLSSGLSDAVIYSNGLGYAVSSGLVWRTENYGSDWYMYSEMNHRNWQEDIAHLNNSFLIPASSGCEGSDFGNGSIHFSTDLGRSWNVYSTPGKLYGSFLTGEHSGWAVGKNRSIYHTKNSGIDWELDNCGIEYGANIDDCYFFNDSTGFVVGDGIYYHIKDTKRFFPISPAKDTLLCGGQSLVIKILGKYDSFQWSNGASGDSIVVTENGKYFVRGLSICDSSHSDTIEVRFAPAPDLHVRANETMLCPGSEALAYSTEHFEAIVWSTGETTDTIHISKPGIYFARTTNEFGCSSYDTVEIKQTQFAKPKISISGSTKFCTGSSALLSVGGNYLSYAWAEASSPQTVLSQRDSLRVWQGGTYFVTVIDSNQCVWQSDTVLITVIDANNSFEIVNQADSEFGSVGIMGQKCRYIFIRNNSAKDQVIDNLFAVGNTVFSVPMWRFPLTIPAQQVDSFVVCFAPRAIGEFVDSVRIGDLCSEWFFAVHGLGTANISYGESGCGPDYSFTSATNKGKNLSIAAIYPSPARESISIVLSGEQSDAADISVYNSTGTKVLCNTDFARQSTTAEASVSQLPAGVYCVVAVSPNAAATAVFVKE